MEYFKDGSEFDLNIMYLFQRNLSGIADAILLTEKYIDQPFVTILGDTFLLTKSFKNMIKFFYEKNAWVVEGVVREENPAKLKATCEVHVGKDGRILDIIEKPINPKYNYRGTGVYIFDPIMYEIIKKTPISPLRNEREITDAIKNAAKKIKPLPS